MKALRGQGVNVEGFERGSDVGWLWRYENDSGLSGAHRSLRRPVKENDEVIAVREKATWRDPALGVARELELPQGRLRCFEAGTGPPIVFAHGLLVNANLWRKVVARLRPSFAASRSICRSAHTRSRCPSTPT